MKIKSGILIASAMALVSILGCSNVEQVSIVEGTLTPTPSALPMPAPTETATPTPAPTVTATPGHGAGPTAIGVPADPALASTAVAASAKATVFIGDVAFAAEVVDDPAERTLGLSERDMLADKSGMLFVFETGSAGTFWMRGMRFPLDLVWIGADCTVVDITFSAPPPPPDASASDLTLYASAVPATFTFEVNAGESKALGIEVGDPVRFTGIDFPAGAGCQ